MKLSEAIRLGAMMKPQGTGYLHSLDGLKSCALGAACDAVGIPISKYFDQHIEAFSAATRRWPFMNWAFVHPVTETPKAVAQIIWDLNDHHHWTRERIADWVSTVEPQDVPATDQTVTGQAQVLA